MGIEVVRTICEFPLWGIASPTHFAMAFDDTKRVEVGKMLIVLSWEGKVRINDFKRFWLIGDWLIFCKGIKAFALKIRRGVRKVIGI